MVNYINPLERDFQSMLNTPGSTSGYERKLPGLNAELTYTREYQSFGPFDLRQSIGEIANRWSSDCKEIGESYQKHQWEINWRNSTTIVRKGFFQVLRTFEGPDKYLNCSAYALGSFQFLIRTSCR